MHYSDATAEAGRIYEYSVVVMLRDGTETRGAVRVAMPAASLALLPTRPNPARAPMRIEYSLALPDAHRIDVLGIDGRRLRTLVSAAGRVGGSEVDWDGRDDAGRTLPAGIYFIRLSQGHRSLVERVALVR